MRAAVATLVLASFLAGACASPLGFPPLWETETDLPGGESAFRAAFGLYERRTLPPAPTEYANPERERAEQERDAAGATRHVVRFLGEIREDPATGESAVHVLPPLYERTDAEASSRRTIFPIYFESRSGTEDQAREGMSDDDVWLFPFVAWGSEPGEGSYFLLLPFGGTLKGKLLADEIKVRGFPFWIETRDDDWKSTHVLWPLIAWGESPDRSHFRALPFWSQSDGQRYRRRSALWPLIHWSQERRGDRDVEGWFLFPLAGHREATDGTSWQWTFLYPFFQFSRDDVTGDSYDAVLWPIHKRSVRPGVGESTWWWPFWGESIAEKERSAFWLWPIGWDQWETRGKQERRRRLIVPLWMHSESGPIGGEPTAGALRSWPLFAWEHDADGRETGRIPEIIPTFGWGPGERVYADSLSLLRWESDAEGRSAWDAPLGLLRYRRDSAGARKLTLLWWIDIPLGDGQ